MALALAPALVIAVPRTASAQWQHSEFDTTTEPAGPAPAPTAASARAAVPWQTYQAAIAFNLGIGSAVGTAGLTLSFVPARFLATEIGIGGGVSGLQLSAMQKVVLGEGETVRFVGGIGISHSGGSNDFPDSALWLNVDLAGLEIRSRGGFLFFVTGGATTALTGGAFRDPIQNDCGKPYCGNAAGAIFPQGRAGVGFWF